MRRAPDGGLWGFPRRAPSVPPPSVGVRCHTANREGILPTGDAFGTCQFTDTAADRGPAPRGHLYNLSAISHFTHPTRGNPAPVLLTYWSLRRTFHEGNRIYVSKRDRA